MAMAKKPVVKKAVAKKTTAKKPSPKNSTPKQYRGMVKKYQDAGLLGQVGNAPLPRPNKYSLDKARALGRKSGEFTGKNSPWNVQANVPLTYTKANPETRAQRIRSNRDALHSAFNEGYSAGSRARGMKPLKKNAKYRAK